LGKELLSDQRRVFHWQFSDDFVRFKLSDIVALLIYPTQGLRMRQLPKDGSNTYVVDVWAVGVVLHSRAPKTCDRLEALLSGSEWAAAAQARGYRDAQRRRGRRSESLRALLSELRIESDAVKLGDSTKLDNTWTAAEVFARWLHVPLIDEVGAVPALQTSDELELPLAERLEKGLLETPDDPGEPPEGVRVEQREPLVIRISRPINWAPLAARLLLGGSGLWWLAVIVAMWGGAETFEHASWIALAIAVASALCYLLIHSVSLGSEIRVTRKSIRVRTGLLQLSQWQERLSKLEALRAMIHQKAGLYLHSDAESKRLAMRQEQAHWITARVARYLAGVSDGE